MQCASCHFENMPGVANCGQCGASMQLASAAIDVNPPRAGAWIKYLRRWLPIRQISYRWRDFFSRSIEAVRRYIPIPKLHSLAIVLRMIVPGWPQMALGRTGLGRSMMRLYLLMLLLTLLFFGSGPGGFFFGLALTIHGASIIDVVWSGVRNYQERILTAIFFIFLVGAICYFPIITGIHQFAVARNILTTYGEFQQGDVLTYSPAYYWFHEPAVGDLVCYRSTQGAEIYEAAAGEYLDRIVARGGQTVTWDKQTLLVDGQPSQWQPLYPLDNFKISVSKDNYCILQAVQQYGGHQVTPTTISQRLLLLSRERILGRVIVLNYPFSRWTWFP